jgi:hypothetical protein
MGRRRILYEGESAEQKQGYDEYRGAWSIVCQGVASKWYVGP